jgi:hypothetical protein
MITTHDQQAMDDLVYHTLVQMELNCKALQLCQFCTGLALITRMAESLVNHASRGEINLARAAYAAETFDALGLRILEEVQRHDS